MAEKENQQEQILSQTKSLYDKFAGGSDLTKGVEQTLNSAGSAAGVTKVVGTVSQMPGTVVEKAGDFVGNVAKAPGEGLQKATNLVGNVANAPGAIVQGAGNLFEKGYDAIGQTIGSGAEAILGKGVGDAIKDTYKVTGGVVKGATNIVGGVLKAPGELIKGVGHFTGEVLKVPGNLLQGASKLVGGILKAPGEILKGIANGTENLLFKTKDGVPTLNGKEIPALNDGTFAAKSPKDVIGALSKGKDPLPPAVHMLKTDPSKFIYGNELNKMDKFAKNIDTLANGKESPDKPFSSILTKPKSERAAAVKEATIQLRSNLHKIKDRLEKNPGSFTPQQQTELKVLMKGIEEQGGIDKYMEKNFDLPEKSPNREKSSNLDKNSQDHSNNEKSESSEKSKDSKDLTPQEKLEDMKKDAQKSTDKAKNSMKKQIESAQKDTKDKTDAFKDKQSSSLEDKDVKPVISGSAPTMQGPTKSINGIGR